MLNQTDLCTYRADAPLPWKATKQHWQDLEPVLWDWLLDPGSLTQRLKVLSQGMFEVQVLHEGWVTGHVAATGMMGMPFRRCMMWSRSVVLCGFREPWVAGHSLIPVSSMKGPLRRIISLRDKPLGGFLFKHPTVNRQPFQIVRLDDEHWGRRSVFTLHGKPMLVADFFLPALIHRLQQTD